MTADRSVLVKLRANVQDYLRGIASARAVTGGFVKDLDSADSRMSNLVQTAMALAPALVPIGGAGVTAIAGLANQLGFAVAGAGTAVLAFQGVGDAMDALNKYQLEPTAANLEKVTQAFGKLSPAARDFVAFLDDVEPKLRRLQKTAAEGLLPGAQEGMEELLKLTPQLRRIIGEISGATGDLLAEAGDNLNDPRWRDFFDFLESEARPTLVALGRTTGNVVEGLANLWAAFDPLNDQFSGGLLEASRDFAEWSRNLDDNESFQNFVEYVQRAGPKAVDTLGDLVSMLSAFVAAAAPVGEATLPVISAVAKVLEAIAESEAGPALILTASALSALSRSVALFNAANGSALAGFLGIGGKSGSGLGQLNQRVNAIKAAGAATGVLAVSLTDLDNQLGIANTATLGLMGSFAGPWGAALGVAAGGVMDLNAALSIGSGELARYLEMTEALAGSSLDAQIAALTKELEVQKEIIGDAFGPSFEVFGTRVTPFEFGNEWRVADDKVAALEERIAQLKHQRELDRLAADGQAEGTERAGAAALRAELKHARLATRLVEERQAARATAGEFITLGDSLDDTQTSLGGWIRELENQARALHNFQINAATAGRRGLREGLIRDLQDMGTAGALRMRQLAHATEEEIARANAAWLAGRRAMKDYVDFKVPPKPIPVDNKPALEGINQVTHQLELLDGKTATVHIKYTAPAPPSTALGLAPTGADGMTVPGPRYPYRDKVFAFLAPGEEVISNRHGQADAFRADRAAGRIPAYGDGGAVEALAGGGTAGVGMSPTSTPGGIVAGNMGDSSWGWLQILASAAQDAAKGVRDHKNALEDDRDSLRELRDARKDLVQAAGGSFDRSIFGEGLEGAFGTLEATRNDANAMTAALKKAKKLGLSGDAFEALAASGDLQTAQELDTKAEIRKFEKLMAQQQAAFGALGQFAGDTAFGKEIGEHLDRQRHTLDRLDKRLAGLEDAVARGAAQGTRQGMSATNRAGYSARG